MTAHRPYPSTSTKTIGTAGRSSPGPRRSRSPHDEAGMAAPLTQEPVTNLRSSPPRSPRSRVRSPGLRHSTPRNSTDSIAERALSALTEPSEEDEANTTSHHIDLTDSASDNDDPNLAGLEETLTPHFQPPPAPRPLLPAPASAIHDSLSPASFSARERHLAQLEIQWKETCEELQEVARNAEDPCNRSEILEQLRKRCQWLQEQERSLRRDIRQLIPRPLDPNLASVHAAWTTYNETLRSYWSQRSHQQP